MIANHGTHASLPEDEKERLADSSRLTVQITNANK
jgi:hypothetical protein